jgi:hypothetical protein
MFGGAQQMQFDGQGGERGQGGHRGQGGPPQGMMAPGAGEAAPDAGATTTTTK